MMMSGETSNISQFCEFTFYDWIMFRYQPVTFPNDNPVLGRYLSPVIDVGPALTAKILKANGGVVYRLTYRALTNGERTNLAYVACLVEFDLSIQDKFGPKTPPDDFINLDIPATPEHKNFDDVDYAGWDDKQLQMTLLILTFPTLLSRTTFIMLITWAGMING